MSIVQGSRAGGRRAEKENEDKRLDGILERAAGRVVREVAAGRVGRHREGNSAADCDGARQPHVDTRERGSNVGTRDYIANMMTLT